MDKTESMISGPIPSPLATAILVIIVFFSAAKVQPIQSF
jgi:hypothetical protein